MNVLIACEESQRVCTAFREKGHNAFSCDIIPCSGGHPEWHIMGDVLKIINGFTLFGTQDDTIHNDLLNCRWDMIIAFPPCTYMTCAGACRMYPKKGVLDPDRYKKSQEAKAFFMEIYNADCDKIVIENPKPLKIVELPEETQRIQPWEFAEAENEFFTKLTYLWEKGVSPLVPLRKAKPEGTKPFVNAGSKKANGEKREMCGIVTTAAERSKTFYGVAQAMADQWG